MWYAAIAEGHTGGAKSLIPVVQAKAARGASETCRCVGAVIGGKGAAGCRSRNSHCFANIANNCAVDVTTNYADIIWRGVQNIGQRLGGCQSDLIHENHP